MTDSEKLKAIEDFLKENLKQARERNYDGCAVEAADIIRGVQEAINDYNFCGINFCCGFVDGEDYTGPIFRGTLHGKPYTIDSAEEFDKINNSLQARLERYKAKKLGAT
jgi:hypothetical protein